MRPGLLVLDTGLYAEKILDKVTYRAYCVNMKPIAYRVNDMWTFRTKKEAFRQARNLASVAYECALRTGKSKAKAEEDSQVFVEPVFGHTVARGAQEKAPARRGA
jgi:hypothetical protein